MVSWLFHMGGDGIRHWQPLGFHHVSPIVQPLKCSSGLWQVFNFQSDVLATATWFRGWTVFWAHGSVLKKAVSATAKQKGNLDTHFQDHWLVYDLNSYKWWSSFSTTNGWRWCGWRPSGLVAQPQVSKAMATGKTRLQTALTVLKRMSKCWLNMLNVGHIDG